MATLLAVCAMALSCSSLLPWHDEPVGQELNFAFNLQNNLLFLPSANVDGHPGRYFFGSADARTVLDGSFAIQQRIHGPVTLILGQRHRIHVTPVILDLGGAGDALLGADVAGTNAVTIDYRAGLITLQKEGIHPEQMTLSRFDGPPAIDITVDGTTVRAIVDTALPDTVVLPAASRSRRNARVVVAGTDFGELDVRYGGTHEARVGNRVLSRFLITIDYGRHEVGLWRDPRIAL